MRLCGPALPLRRGAPNRVGSIFRLGLPRLRRSVHVRSGPFALYSRRTHRFDTFARQTLWLGPRSAPDSGIADGPRGTQASISQAFAYSPRGVGAPGWGAPRGAGAIGDRRDRHALRARLTVVISGRGLRAWQATRRMRSGLPPLCAGATVVGCRCMPGVFGAAVRACAWRASPAARTYDRAALCRATLLAAPGEAARVSVVGRLPVRVSCRCRRRRTN